MLPAQCAVGASYFKIDAVPGENVYVCSQPNVWKALGASKLPAMPGNQGTVLTTDGTAAVWTPIGGDVQGWPADVTVRRLQGRDVAGSVPADGNVLRWSAAEGWWRPGAAGLPNYAGSFTEQTEVWIPATAHGLGSTHLVVDCYDSSTPAHRVEPDSVSIDPATLDVRVSFAAPQSGRCVINGSETAASGGQTVAATEVESGLGLISARVGQKTTVRLDTAVVPTFVSAEAQLTFSAIAAGTCAERVLALPGAAAGDAVAPGWPASLAAGLMGMMRATTAGSVTVRLCNLGSSAVPEWTDTYAATITRSF